VGVVQLEVIIENLDKKLNLKSLSPLDSPATTKAPATLPNHPAVQDTRDANVKPCPMFASQMNLVKMVEFVRHFQEINTPATVLWATLATTANT
jgi:hypothetical protein